MSTLNLAVGSHGWGVGRSTEVGSHGWGVGRSTEVGSHGWGWVGLLR